MANPLKFLTPVSASAGMEVSGAAGLTVDQGPLTVNNGLTTLKQGLQVSGSTSTSGSLTVGGQGGLTVKGNTVLGNQATDTVGVSGSLTVSGSTVLGQDKNTDTVEVTGNLGVDGDVTISGNLTVSGFVTGSVVQINTTNTVVKDQFLYLNSGSEGITTDEGGVKVAVSGAAGEYEGQISFVSGSGWKLTEGDLTGAGDNTSLTTLSDLQLSSLSASTNVTVGEQLTVGGAVLVSVGSASFGQAGLNAQTSSVGGGLTVIDLSGALRAIDTALNSGGNATAAIKANYGNLRFVKTGSIAGDTVTVNVSDLSNSSFLTGAYVDFVVADVSIKTGSLAPWTNDLVSVWVANVDNDLVVTIDAPASTAGYEYKLVVINESGSLL